MCVYLIASYTKSAHLFALHQSFPQSKSNAVSLTELIANCDDNPDNYTKERKNLESDLIGLNQTFNDIFYSDALVRVPRWGEKISGQIARFYIEPSFSIDVINEQTVFF